MDSKKVLDITLGSTEPVNKEIAKLEKNEVTKSEDIGQAASQKRVMTDICNRYSAVQAGVKMLRNPDGGHDLQALVDEEKQASKDMFQSLGANDALKTMLVAQMAAVHDMHQDAYLGAKGLHDPQAIQAQINIVTKLSNVFIQQISALERIQGKGHQKVIVEHVHVHDGGQAIVGSVETQGRLGHGREKK